MKKSVLILLLILPLCAYAAERVVLLEDFTNHTCGPCWTLEPGLNAIVDARLATGDISVVRVHVNWPGGSDPIYLANPTEQNARKGFYGISSVPTIKIDGIGVSADSSAITNRITQRLAQPSHLEIFVARNGNDQTGTVSIGLVAEQDLQAQDQLRLLCILVENDVTGTGHWSGTVFEQAFRDNLFGPAGPIVEFTGPYPDTLYFETDYDITAWVNDHLYLATWVQEYSSSHKEVMNANFDKFIDLPTGIEGGSPVFDEPLISIGPNPSSGHFSVSVEFTGQTPAFISVFDITGRQVTSTEMMTGETAAFGIDSSGLYFVRMITPDGLSVTRSLAVVR